MSQQITISKLVNEIGFKIRENEYRKCTDRIKRMAGLWTKSTSQMTKSMESGKRIANAQTKAVDKQSRAELRAYRTRQSILKADNIRYSDQIKASRQFQASLQKINSDFLKGTTNAKMRSAQISQLTKQYRNLNTQAQQHNKITSIASKMGPGVRGGIGLGVGVGAGVATAGLAAGYAVHQGYNKVKQEGQKYEALSVGLQNIFGDRAIEISNKIRTMADKNGAPVVELGNQLVEFVSLMKPLGVSVDDALKRFQQTNDAMQSYGIGGERGAGFQQQLTQALDQGTLDSFKEAFAWAPTLRADLLQYVKDTMKVNQKDFLGGLTNGKFSLKDVWFKFLSANESKYSKMSSLYKQSSMANDARADNSISLAIYRVFSSSGFQEALKYTTGLLNRWGSFLESNAKQIGEVFGNLYKITGELADGALKDLTSWLKTLTAEDIKTWFNDFKSGIQDLAFIVKTVATKLKAMFPDLTPNAKGQYYVEREKHWLNQGYEGQEAGRLADGEMRKKFGLGFTVPSFADNFVTRRANQTPAQSNFAGTLSLQVDAHVNQQGFGDLIDIKINDFSNQQINMIGVN